MSFSRVFPIFERTSVKHEERRFSPQSQSAGSDKVMMGMELVYMQITVYMMTGEIAPLTQVNPIWCFCGSQFLILIA